MEADRPLLVNPTAATATACSLDALQLQAVRAILHALPFSSDLKVLLLVQRSLNGFGPEYMN